MQCCVGTLQHGLAAEGVSHLTKIFSTSLSSSVDSMQCCVGTLNLDWNAEFRNLDSVLLVRLNRAGGHFLTGTMVD
jgi:hypothetical protein